MRIAGTGSRRIIPFTCLSSLYSVIKKIHDICISMDTKLVLISGMAEGWDEEIAKAALSHDLEFEAYIPNPTYINYYWSSKQSIYKRDRTTEAHSLVEAARSKVIVRPDPKGSNGIYGHANFDRNQAMVDNADAFFVYNPTSRGTADCYCRILRTGKPYFIFDDDGKVTVNPSDYLSNHISYIER